MQQSEKQPINYTNRLYCFNDPMSETTATAQVIQEVKAVGAAPATPDSTVAPAAPVVATETAPGPQATPVTAAKRPARKTVTATPALHSTVAEPPKTTASTDGSDKETKVKKSKLVRDSFTIPKDEYLVLDLLKQRTAQLGHPAKKSELLRAGIKLLAGLSDAALRKAVGAVPAIKTGRPRSDKTGETSEKTKAKAGKK